MAARPKTRRRKSNNSRVALTVRDVCAALDRIAPTKLAQSWDNVGLLAGDNDASVRRVLLCIDLMPPVVSEALRSGCELVVAYHPPIFRPIARLVAPSDAMEAGVLRCVAGGTAVYAVHTAFDAAPGGANDVLAELCDLTEPTAFELSDDESSLAEPAIGRVGRFQPPITLARLVRKLKRRTGAGNVSIVGQPNRRLKRGVVVVGAAGSLPLQVGLRAGDVVVTGEIRHHDALRLQRCGACAVSLSHWSSERPALAVLAAQLANALPGLRVQLSRRDAEPFVRV